MKIKRFLSTLTALMLTATSSFPISTNAEYDEEYMKSLTKTAIDSLNQEYEIFTHSDEEDGLFGYITEDDVYFLNVANFYDCIVKFSKDTESTCRTEINNKLFPDFILYTTSEDNVYTLEQLGTSTTMTEDEAIDIISEYSGLLSVDKDVYEVVHCVYPWTLYGIEVNSDLTAEEISEKYPELTLAISEETPSEEYIYRLDFTDIKLSTLNCQKEYAPFFVDNEAYASYKINFNLYDVVKKLNSDTEIDNWRFVSLYGSADMIYKSNYFYDGKSSMYIAPITGDTNVDGDINISDVLTVSAHINNKDKYPMEEQSAINGDVHNTGNGLNSSDAFMIQQYVTGVIESL